MMKREGRSGQTNFNFANTARPFKAALGIFCHCTAKKGDPDSDSRAITKAISR